MPVLATTRRQVRFGPFTVDLVSRELRKEDSKVPLQGLPFQILTILVDQPGEWITREELRQRLWHADTFVDFDHSINTAIGKLRRALGDDADEPRYIETLPRHGYRLIAEVEDERPQQDSKVAKQKLWKMVVPSAVLPVGLIAGWLLYPRRQVGALTDKDTIVLSDFDNKTGDAVFDDTLKQGLSVQLEQSPFLAMVSERKVIETLKMMGRSADDRLTPEVTHEVCLRTGSKAIVTGSIVGLGSQYVIGLKAVNCNTGDVLAEAQQQASGKEAVLKALDNAAISLRGKLGESLSSVQKYATPLEEATTPSLEALKVYSLGLKTWAAKGDTAAQPFYKRAVDLDPNFAMAYAQMSVLYHDLNEIAGAAENGRKAYDLREKVSERERFWIESGYYDFVTGELEKGAQVDELWLQTYPRDAMPYTELGFVSATLGNWEKALEEWQVAVRLDPKNGLLYYLLSLAYMSQNRLDEAEAVFKQAEERNLDNEQLLQSRYWLAFLKGDTAQMAQLVSGATGEPGAEDLLLASGHGRLARQAEGRARPYPSGDGFSPAQRRPRNGRRISGRGSTARGGIGKPEAGPCRRQCGVEASPEPRCANYDGAGSGSGRR